jgi:acyl dehydratase
VPGAQSLVYNGSAATHHTLVFSSAGGKQISTTDPEAAATSSPLKVSLSVAHGTLTLAQTTNSDGVGNSAAVGRKKAHERRIVAHLGSARASAVRADRRRMVSGFVRCDG